MAKGKPRRYVRFTEGEPVRLRLAGEFEKVERELCGTKYTRHECPVETEDGEGDTLSVGAMTLRSLQDLFDSGFPENGWYRIVRRGVGIRTRYQVVPLRWTPDGRSQCPDDLRDENAGGTGVPWIQRVPWIRSLVGTGWRKRRAAEGRPSARRLFPTAEQAAEQLRGHG